ncbi:MAG: 3-hydroxymyristoyl/3-hydroxydecanoyl-(acyl carrier protein) dehydratase, partial [Kiritimatiellia bacterium]
AFHARRMGLRLVPDWPLTSMLAPPDPDPTRSVATVDGFRFDYSSLIHCALGRPSKAFGPIYQRFDGPRTVPRLPGPPYHFMSRIVEVTGQIGGMEQGSTVVVEYDIPQDAWYFKENGSPVMPFCVLMEAALQPCGWLASYAGPTLTTDDDLAFRNLDGEGTIHGEVGPGDKRLTTTSTLDSIARVGSMVIVRFTVKCRVADKLIYDLKTVFGFFPAEALASQNGLPASDAELAQLTASSEESHDLTIRPSSAFDGPARLAELGPQATAGQGAIGLCMLDRISGYWPDAGEAGLGRARGEKDVHTSEWMFAAHFFQDPVQPGSLGVEALTQLLQWTMLRKGLDKGLDRPRFEAIATEQDHSWTYRGQVVGANERVTAEVELIEIVEESHGVLAIAKAWLWVDGKRIYHLPRLCMRLVDEADKAVKDSIIRNGGLVLDASELVSAEGSVRSFWDAQFDRTGWPTEDICYGLVNRYVRNVIIEDAEALQRLEGKSVLFLANHQNAVESWLFAIIASGLLHRPTVALAKDEHRHTWLGRISDHSFSWPDVVDPELIVFFDRDNIESLRGIVEGLAPGLAMNKKSVLVHVEGTRSTTCRRIPVKFMASIFVELAMKTQTAIVPVRFTGGLPIEGDEKVEFPSGHGKQDYWIGKPIFPEELQAYSYRDRKYAIISAINHLGPAWHSAEPIADDPDLAAEIEAWSERSGVSLEHSALLSNLRRVQDKHPMSEAIVAAADGAELELPEGPEGEWMRELAKRLLG